MDQTRQTGGYHQQYSGGNGIVSGRHAYLFILALSLIGLVGCDRSTAPVQQRTSVLTAVSPDRSAVATVVPVDDKYILLLDNQPILPLTAVPTWLEFSPANNALGFIVNGELYRYDIPTQTATRLGEDVLTAEWSASGKDVNF